MINPEIYIPCGVPDSDFVKHVGVKSLKILFNKRVLADFKGIQTDKFNDVCR